MNALLSGVRVLDLTHVVAGPYGSMLLGDLGAEIIKIEKPGEGDESREIGPEFINGESAYFIGLNRNKKGITLDLLRDEGKEIFYALVKKADVVYDNFKPIVTRKLGIDYETLKNINPKIITCSISAFGSEGPLKDEPGFDIIFQAIGGIMSLTGEPGRPPVKMGVPMGDLEGGLLAAYAITSALYARQATGVGRKIEISLLDATVSMLSYIAAQYFASGRVREPLGSGHPFIVPSGAFKTKDGYIQITCSKDKVWKSLCQALQIGHLAEDPRFFSKSKRYENRKELLPILEDILLSRTIEEWLTCLRGKGVPAAPVNTIDKTLSEPQILLRNMVVTLNHPVTGNVKVVGNPIKIGDYQELFEPAPTLGQHTEEILQGLLGYTKDDISRLKKNGIV